METEISNQTYVHVNFIENITLPGALNKSTNSTTFFNICTTNTALSTRINTNTTSVIYESDIYDHNVPDKEDQKLIKMYQDLGKYLIFFFFKCFF